MGWDTDAWSGSNVWHAHKCMLDLYNALTERYTAVFGAAPPGAFAAPSIWHTESWLTTFDTYLLSTAKKNGVSEIGTPSYPQGSAWAFIDHTQESSGKYDSWIASNSNAPPPRVGQSTDANTWNKLLTMAGETTLKTIDTWHYRAVLEQRKKLVQALSQVAHFVSEKTGSSNRKAVQYKIQHDSPGQSKQAWTPATRLAKIQAAITAAEAAASTASAAAFAYNSGIAGRYATIEWYQDNNDGFSGEWFLTVQAEALIGELGLAFGSPLAADVDIYFRKTADRSADDMTWLIENTDYYEVKSNEHDTFSHSFNLPTGAVASYMTRYATKSRSAGTALSHLISDQTLEFSWPSTTDPNVDGVSGGYYVSVRGYNIGHNAATNVQSYNYLATNVGTLYPLGVAVIKYDWDYP